MNQRVCVVGPGVSGGLGLDLGPIIDSISQAGEKYLDYKQAQDAAKQQAALLQLQQLQQQRQLIAAGAGGISGITLALGAAALFFLMARKR